MYICLPGAGAYNLLFEGQMHNKFYDYVNNLR